jgi:hypothetical protein
MDEKSKFSQRRHVMTVTHCPRGILLPNRTGPYLQVSRFSDCYLKGAEAKNY